MEDEHAVLIVKLTDRGQLAYNRSAVVPYLQETGGSSLKSHLGPCKLNMLPMRLLIMPGSTPVAV